jgi:hypothetical protein
MKARIYLNAVVRIPFESLRGYTNEDLYRIHSWLSREYFGENWTISAMKENFIEECWEFQVVGDGYDEDLQM